MGRLACVDVPSLPLQLLLRRHPEWRSHPAAVVDKDHPQGRVLWVNERALRGHVLPGIRYAEGLSLAADLRAGVISTSEIQEAIDELARRLAKFTPVVEPAAEFPGVFWLDPEGLARLCPSLETWVEAIARTLGRHRFRVHVALGFTRFGTYAAVKTRPGVTVFHEREREQRFAGKVRLARLGIEPKIRDALHKLGVTTVAGLLELPPTGLRARFGAQIHHLRQWITGCEWNPLQPISLEEPPQQILDSDEPVANRNSLLFAIKRRLPKVLEELTAQARALEELELRFHTEGGEVITESIRPASPTLQASLLLQLIALRLESIRFREGVLRIVLQVTQSCSASPEQLLLFRDHSERDLRAAERALARLRARFGDRAVVRMVPQDRHLPEASYALEPIPTLHEPVVQVAKPQLVRRLLDRPLPLPPRPRHRHDNGWLVHGIGRGAAVDEIGPVRPVSGGWWRREVHREYHFVKTLHGDLLWIYYDRPRRRWFLQGEVH